MYVYLQFTYLYCLQWITRTTVSYVKSLISYENKCKIIPLTHAKTLYLDEGKSFFKMKLKTRFGIMPDDNNTLK